MNDKYERDIIERKTQKMNGLNVKYGRDIKCMIVSNDIIFYLDT